MIDYIPIFTTIFSVFFLTKIWPHYLEGKKRYVLWWALGVFTFGLGTFTESINALAGWSEANLKFWYISGALLGGFPLAQGTIYLLMKKKFADYSAIIVCILIAVASVFIILSPVSLPENFDGGLTGRVFEWEWVRMFSPFINLYSFVFLFGGAVYSAIWYFRHTDGRKRFIGNIYIATGALLPGIGGSFTRFGHVEVLFVTELIGLVLIYSGYIIIRKKKIN